MEATVKTFEITIPGQYVTTFRNIIKAFGGKMKAIKSTRKTGLDEALEDIKAGRVSKIYTDMDELWKDLNA